MSGRAVLAPDRMTDEQLWKFVKGRAMTARLMCMESGRREECASVLEVMQVALLELERRSFQGWLVPLEYP
jgi:hypothetical protein